MFLFRASRREGAIIHARKHIVDIGEASHFSINLKGEEGRREHWLLAPMLAWVVGLQGVALGSRRLSES